MQLLVLCFNTLIFLQKYYKTPLRQLNIGFLYKKKYISPKNITTKMYNLYQLTNKPLKSPPQNYVIFFSDLKKEDLIYGTLYHYFSDRYI